MHLHQSAPRVMASASTITVMCRRLVIIKVGITVLDLIPKHGRLDGKKLHALFDHLRKEWVTPYISGYVNGKLGKYDDW